MHVERNALPNSSKFIGNTEREEGFQNHCLLLWDLKLLRPVISRGFRGSNQSNWFFQALGEVSKGIFYKDLLF